MKTVAIHDLPDFRVVSHGNGWAYEIQFGGGGGPFLTRWVQDEDATETRKRVEELEEAHPERDFADIWAEALDL